MKTLHRYVARQVLVTLTMTVGVFTGLFLLANALKELLPLLLNPQVPALSVLGAAALLVPFGLVFALPMGLLTATLLVFGRLSADQELTAVRAGGVSLVALVAPVLAIGVLAAGLSAWLTMEVAPRCRLAFKELFLTLGTARPAALLVEQRHITDFPGWTLYIGRRHSERELENVLLFESRQDQLARRIHARRALVTPDPATRQIVLQLFDAEVFSKSLLPAAGTNAAASPVPAGSGDWNLVLFEEAPPIRLDLTAAQAAGGRPKLNDLSFRELLAERAALRARGVDATPVLVNLHRQVSFSFACVSFVLLGIPLGLRGHRRETSIGLAAALLLTAIYYSFIILGQALETRPQWHPHLLVWVPNLLFQGLGAWLLWRADRSA